MNAIHLNKAVFLLSALLCSSDAFAGTAEVTWQNPDKYTDIKPSNGTDKSYRKSVDKALGGEFKKLAEKLPSGQKLTVNVTNLDLAGEVDPIPSRGGYQLRVLKDSYYPQMVFEYKITDATGKSVQESKTVDIKDMGFMSGSVNAASSQDFYYERRMIREWFNKDVMTKDK